MTSEKTRNIFVLVFFSSLPINDAALLHEKTVFSVLLHACA